MDDKNSGGHDFDMCTSVEDHMSKEDLGSEGSFPRKNAVRLKKLSHKTKSPAT